MFGHPGIVPVHGQFGSELPTEMGGVADVVEIAVSEYGEVEVSRLHPAMANSPSSWARRFELPVSTRTKPVPVSTR